MARNCQFQTISQTHVYNIKSINFLKLSKSDNFWNWPNLTISEICQICQFQKLSDLDNFQKFILFILYTWVCELVWNWQFRAISKLVPKPWNLYFLCYRQQLYTFLILFILFYTFAWLFWHSKMVDKVLGQLKCPDLANFRKI